jgi:voltage-dependent calcium channel T type alpha-1G
MHQIFNYIISMVIFLNIIFLLIKSPTNYPDQDTSSIVNILDLVCTLIFILEAILKIIALGFIFTTLENQRAYLNEMWNITDFFVIIMALFDLFSFH